MNPENIDEVTDISKEILSRMATVRGESVNAIAHRLNDKALTRSEPWD